MSLKNDLKDLIAKSKIEEAIHLLRHKELIKSFSQAQQNEIINIASKFSQLRKKESTGHITPENANIKDNHIVNSLLSLIDEIGQSLDIGNFQISAKSEQANNIYLRSSDEFDSFESIAEEAEEIFIFSANAKNLIIGNETFLEKKLKPGNIKRLKILIFDKNSNGFREWSKISKKYDPPKTRIKNTLDWLEPIVKKLDKEIWEIRQWKLIMPYNAVYLKLPSEEKIIVQFYTYNFSVDTKPHVIISSKDNSKFFNLFKEQIDWAWEEAKNDVYSLGS